VTARAHSAPCRAAASPGGKRSGSHPGRSLLRVLARLGRSVRTRLDPPKVRLVYDPAYERAMAGVPLDPLRADTDPLWKMTIVPITEVGTDPTAAMNFVHRTVDLTRTGLAPEEVLAAAQPALTEARHRLELLDAKVAEAAAKKDPAAESLAGAARYERDRVEKTAAAVAGVKMSEVPLGLALHFLGLIVRERYYDEHGFSPEKRARNCSFCSGVPVACTAAPPSPWPGKASARCGKPNPPASP